MIFEWIKETNKVQDQTSLSLPEIKDAIYERLLDNYVAQDPEHNSIIN